MTSALRTEATLWYAMAAHPVKRADRKPSFFWQGVLILTPVLVLAKLAALAISEDKRAAYHDAEVRAQEITERYAAEIWSALTAPDEDVLQMALGRKPWTNAISSRANAQFHVPDGVLIKVDAQGRLLNPTHYVAVPEPTPLPFADLDEKQRTFWTDARSAAWTNNDKATEAFKAFLATRPPQRFAQLAEMEQALIEQRLGHTVAAREFFLRLATNETSALTESGIPISAAALGGLLRLSTEHAAFVRRQARLHPSSLTPGIITELEQRAPEMGKSARWDWLDDEFRRQLYAAARPLFVTNEIDQLNAVHEEQVFESFTNAPGLSRVTNSVVILSATTFTATQRTRVTTNAAALMRVTPPKLFWTQPVHYVSNRLTGDYYKTNSIALCARTDAPDGYVLLFRSWSEVFFKIYTLPHPLRGQEPWLGFTVSLGGGEILGTNSLYSLAMRPGGKGSGQRLERVSLVAVPERLATANLSDDSGMKLVVQAFLTTPDLLYASQHDRARTIQGLILTALFAAGVGLFFAWRAFRKQLRLSELKSNFVSSVSHELRAPIASVRLMAEGLERGKISEPAKQQEYFRFITQECRRLSAMIENVLDFARIEQGRKQYEFEPTDVVALVEQTVKLMEPYAAERKVKLSLNVPPASCRFEDVALSSSSLVPSEDSPSVGVTRQDAGGTLVDGAAIQQALVNLIDNAIKHSPAGSEVLVALNFQSSTLSLSVSDSGPGIPASEHAKIFERFYRLGSELRRETPGVGIGLSIVKHIVEAHGGRVLVQSEVSKGACFTIELPVFATESQRRREEIR